MRLYPALTPGGKGSPISRLKTVPTPVSDLCPPSHAGTAEATAWTSHAPRLELGPLPPAPSAARCLGVRAQRQVGRAASRGGATALPPGSRESRAAGTVRTPQRPHSRHVARSWGPPRAARKAERAERKAGRAPSHRPTPYFPPLLRSGRLPAVRCVCGMHRKRAVSLVRFKRVRASFALTAAGAAAPTPARARRGLAAAGHREFFLPCALRTSYKVN